MKPVRLLITLLLIFSLSACQALELPRFRINLPWLNEPIILPLLPLTATPQANNNNQSTAYAPKRTLEPSVSDSPVPVVEQKPVFFPQLLSITVSTVTRLSPAPWQSPADLPVRAIQPDERVQLVASDPNGAWLLVLHQNTLGWLPSILLTGGSGTLSTTTLAINEVNRCDGYIGSTLSLAQPWQALMDGEVRVQGLAFIPPGISVTYWSLTVKETDQQIPISITRTALNQGGEVVFFSQPVGWLANGSTLTFEVSTGEGGYIPFQASFYTADCSMAVQSTGVPPGDGSDLAPAQAATIRVITLQVITTSEASTSIPRNASGATQPWEACKNTYLSRLQVGDWAYVSHTPPKYNRVRKMPYIDSPILGRIGPGERMRIIKGPSCSNGYVWWKVRAEKDNLTGWTAEGDINNYWLIPDSQH